MVNDSFSLGWLARQTIVEGRRSDFIVYLVDYEVKIEMARGDARFSHRAMGEGRDAQEFHREFSDAVLRQSGNPWFLFWTSGVRRAFRQNHCAVGAGAQKI
jgi:hypothetical protein